MKLEKQEQASCPKKKNNSRQSKEGQIMVLFGKVSNPTERREEEKGLGGAGDWHSGSRKGTEGQ